MKALGFVLTLCLITSFAFSAEAALADNLVSYWKLDEASGNAADSAGSNTGTVTGVTYGATGKINDAFEFDGGDDVN